MTYVRVGSVPNEQRDRRAQGDPPRPRRGYAEYGYPRDQSDERSALFYLVIAGFLPESVVLSSDSVQG
jgi:hypothetical protein